MPTFFQQPIDVQWVVALASAGTTIGWFPALAAAVALSAANTNQPVQIAVVNQTANSDAPGPLTATVRLDSSPGTPQYIVQLQSTATSYPLATALTAAYVLSTANANTDVNIARVIEVVTAP